MSAELFLALVLVLTPAILSPGPSIIACTQMALAQGQDKALPYALGLAFGASLWRLFALMGLSVVLQLYPPLFSAAKAFGAAYLTWMAFGLWRAASQPLADAADSRFGRGFFGGMILSLSNPKPALFYSAVILSLFPDPDGAVMVAAIYATALTTELFLYSAVSLGMSTRTMRARYFAAKTWIDRTAALALLALAVMLLFNL